MDIKALPKFRPTFKLPAVPKLNKQSITIAVLLVLIVISAFWLRSLPARFGELQAIDPFYLYRMSEYVLENNWQMPEVDLMRHNPFGAKPIASDPPLLYYLPALIYAAGGGFGMAYLQFAILFPALMGALAVLIIFFLGRELFGTRAGLFASFFLAILPAFITRTSAGFFEKEGISGALLLLTVYSFILAYRRNSWKHGIVSGLSVMFLFQTWGGANYFYLLIGGFVFIMLLLNRYSENIFKSYVPFAVIGTLFLQLFPFHSSLWSYEMVLTLGILVILLVRFSIERFRLVKEQKMKYITPLIVVVCAVAFLMSSIFIDQTYNIIMSLLNLIYLQKGTAASTVAEQMPGSWSDIASALGTSYAGSILNPVAFILPYFTVYLFMWVGVALLCYKFYRKMDWIYILLLIWLLSCVWSVFSMIRLLFLLGPPAALFAGYAVSEIIKYASKTKVIERAKTLRGMVNYVSLPVVAMITLLLVINVANGYVYSNTLGPSFNNYWKEAMDFLATETPEGSNILSWWDFGYWFQTRGQRPSVSDGGGSGPRFDIAIWFMNDAKNWSDYNCDFELEDKMSCEEWLKGRYHVDYILMDYTLPAKYGAISKIGSKDKATVGILQFDQSGIYPQGNKTIYEFKSGPYSIWLPMSQAGSVDGTPMFLVSQGDQYVSRAYINKICTTSGIISVGNEDQDIGGCIAITNFGVFYVPEEAHRNVFSNLMFMDGYGLPVEKVFDNAAIRIYKIIYEDEQSPPKLFEDTSNIEDFLGISGQLP